MKGYEVIFLLLREAPDERNARQANEGNGIRYQTLPMAGRCPLDDENDFEDFEVTTAEFSSDTDEEALQHETTALN